MKALIYAVLLLLLGHVNAWSSSSIKDPHPMICFIDAINKEIRRNYSSIEDLVSKQCPDVTKFQEQIEKKEIDEKDGCIFHYRALLRCLRRVYSKYNCAPTLWSTACEIYVTHLRDSLMREDFGIDCYISTKRYCHKQDTLDDDYFHEQAAPDWNKEPSNVATTTQAPKVTDAYGEFQKQDLENFWKQFPESNEHSAKEEASKPPGIHPEEPYQERPKIPPETPIENHPKEWKAIQKELKKVYKTVPEKVLRETMKGSQENLLDDFPQEILNLQQKMLKFNEKHVEEILNAAEKRLNQFRKETKNLGFEKDPYDKPMSSIFYSNLEQEVLKMQNKIWEVQQQELPKLLEEMEKRMQKLQN